MQIILLHDVDKVGRRGETVNVADGYARNYLIPRNLAVPASGGTYRAWQHDIASREEQRKKERAVAEINAQRISSTTLTMGVKVGEGGKLYGSITAKDIADALAAYLVDLGGEIVTGHEVTAIADLPPARADAARTALATARSEVTAGFVEVETLGM